MEVRDIEHIKYMMDLVQQTNDEIKHLETDLEKANETILDEQQPIEISYLNSVEIKRERAIRDLNSIFAPLDLFVLSRNPIKPEHEGPKYLAFIDILGFSNIVKEQTAKNNLSIILGTVIRAVQKGLSGTRDGGGFYVKLRPNGLEIDITKAKVNNLFFSDTIMFWTNDDSAASLLDLIETVNELFVWCIYTSRIPLRGSITHGNLQYNDGLIMHPNVKINQSALYGKAIVDAAELEKCQQWMGCSFSESCTKAFYQSESSDAQKERFSNYIVEYDVPEKNIIKFWKFAFFSQKHTKRTVLQWVFENRSLESTIEDINQCFTTYTGVKVLKPEVKIKLTNTIKFAKFILTKKFKNDKSKD